MKLFNRLALTSCCLSVIEVFSLISYRFIEQKVSFIIYTPWYFMRIAEERANCNENEIKLEKSIIHF